MSSGMALSSHEAPGVITCGAIYIVEVTLQRVRLNKELNIVQESKPAVNFGAFPPSSSSFVLKPKRKRALASQNQQLVCILERSSIPS